MPTRRDRITKKALELLESRPEGYKYSELSKILKEIFPEIPIGTIYGTIWNLHTRYPEKIYKPARGLFRSTKYEAEDLQPQASDQRSKVPEEAFYQSFADWLVNEIEECTHAIPLGGHRFRDKWGTPDVLGKRESRRSDIIKAPTEIVSAEIKIDSGQLIIAFGQACSYRLFSHKVYLVIPESAAQEDIARLDALCMVFGLGFILFNAQDPDNPDFKIRVRAVSNPPDLFYANKYMKYVEKELFS